MGIAQSLFWRGVIGNWQLLSKMLFVDRKYTVHCFHDPIFQNQIENLNKTKIAENFIKRSKISNLLCCWSRHCLEVPVQNNMNCLGIKLYKMNSLTFELHEAGAKILHIFLPGWKQAPMCHWRPAHCERGGEPRVGACFLLQGLQGDLLHLHVDLLHLQAGGGPLPSLRLPSWCFWTTFWLTWGGGKG